MAYSDFTIERLMQEFDIDVRGERFSLADAPEVMPSAWLLESLQRANTVGFGGEKSRSERLISPMLLELSKNNHDRFAIISGGSLAINLTQSLPEECDFVLSFSRLYEFAQAPVFGVIAVGYPDIEDSTVRCAAQLIEAARFNERKNKTIPILYGCVTTGIEWRFLRLEKQVLTFDNTCYFINETAKLLGILQQLVDQAQPVAST